MCKIGKFLKVFFFIFLLIILMTGKLIASEGLTDEERSLLQLLDKYKSNIPDIANRMLNAKPEETVKLGADEERLINETANFFNELLSRGKGTQAFQKLRGTVPNWNSQYLGIERALMMGRALIVQKVLKDTLIQFYNDNPEAIGTIYGEMDIGTWVKMQTKTLQFDKDIDFSSLATDDHLNMRLRDAFMQNLQKITRVTNPDIMIKMDALITPHGRASEEVFIGEWGKTFAEMDLLARGKWKLIMLKLEDGRVISPDEAKKLKLQGKTLKVVDIQTKEMPGSQMFWWRAFLEGKDFDPPDVTIETEPMLSLEMSRHLIADIERRGQYSGVDKLLKIMKYVERSYKYNKQATAKYRSEWDPFDDNDRILGEFAVEITKAKQAKDAAIEMAKVMDKYKDKLGLEGIIKGDRESSDKAIDELLKRAKKSIIKNVDVALALRLRQIAGIKDDNERNQDLDKMLEQMAHELEAYKHHVGADPEGRVKDIIWLSRKLREGDKWSPEVVKQTMDDLIKELSTENYQMDRTIIEYIFSADDARQLRIYLRETMKWTEERINKFIDDLRKKYPNLAKGYDRLKHDYENIGEEMPTFQKIHKRIVEFNEEWSNTLEGSTFMKSLDFADNLITFIDAGLSEEHLGKAIFKVAGAYLKVKAVGALPSLQIAEGIMEAYKTGDSGPAIKAFAFYYFPTVGAFYGLGEKLQRLDTYVRDQEFLYHLDNIRSLMIFDPKTGHITGIKTGKYSDVFEFQYSPNEEQRANNFADFFMKSDNLLSPNELPKFRFWVSLIPRDASRYGYGSDAVRKGDEALSSAGKTWIGEKLGLGSLDISGKKAKFQKLKKYFANNEELLTAVLILENANEAPSFTDIAGPKLAKKRQELLQNLEDRIERAMWKSLFYLLEASATPPEDLKKLIKNLEKLEDELNLRDTDLSDIRGYNNGVMSTIKKEIKEQISKDYYGKFVYDKYYKAYSQIKKIQSEIILLWTMKYGINWERIISSPFKFIIGGDKRSAPRLTLDIDSDIKNSTESLLAHQKMAGKVEADLRNALGHSPKTDEELRNRRELAQIGFEIEHLLDDCQERVFENCQADIQDLILKRYKHYRDYLASLKKIPCEYKYSEWSPCDPKTKKQTRRVISKSPDGCIEKEKPEIERDCKPLEDTNKQKADRLWNECIERARVKQYEEALQKCEESLTYWSDEKRRNAVNQLREQVRKEKIAQEEKERLEREKLEKERKEKEKKVEKPSCTYEYSEWGPCDRQTKKQTRTVTAKKPEGCEERQKPILEQGCTPPPTEEEKRHQYFNCLCRCSSGWAGHIGVWYDPEGKTKPGCESSGPCIGGIGAFGCSRRHFFNAPNDCAKGCWESAFGKDTYDPNKADKMRREENKKYAKPITVKLKASKNPADFGDVVDIQAQVSEGTGGYTYNWSGCAEDAKDYNAKVSFKNECKSCTVSIRVTDQDGNSASDSLNMQCNAIKVKLTKESPKESTIPIGGKATFYAEVFSGDKPFSGPTLNYLWERNPDALFGDPKNPQYEQKGGSQMRHSATFRKIGTTPVWVVVQREIDGIWKTIGQSEQIPIQVVKPELIIKYAPEKPMIGQEVKLEVSTNPKIGDDMVSFWWDIPNYFSGTGDKASIKPKDSKPIKVIAHAKAKDGGDDIGMKEITITAQGYQVSISEPRYLGPKPKIWKCDTQLGGACPGLVDVADNQFAVFRDIFMKATVTPIPESPRYKWSVDPAGSCGFPGAGDEIKINCSQTGTYTVKVEVTNAEGVKLGEATQTVTISISQEQIDGANKSKQAYDKIQQAKTLVGQGKLDEAINLVQEAVSLDPKNAEAKTLSDKWKKDRESITKHIENINNFINEKKFPEAEKELNNAKSLHPKYSKVIEIEQKLIEAKAKHKRDVTDKINEAKRLLNEKKIDDAVAVIKDVAKIDKTSAQPVMNEISSTAKNIGWDALHKGDYTLAIKRLEQSVDLNPADTDAQNKLKEAKDYQAKMPQIEAKMKEFDSLITQKKIVSSYQKLLEVQDILRTIGSSGLSANNPIVIKYNKDYNELNKWYNELIQKTNSELTKLNQQKAWESSEKLLTEILKYEHTEANKRNYESSLQMVRGLIAEEKNKKQKADQLWDECSYLTKQNKLNEALSKCRESLNYWSNDNRRNAMAKLEQEIGKKQKADELWNQCISLAKQNRLNEAVSICEQSLGIWSNEDRNKAFANLKGEVQKANEQAQRKAQADKLWDECTTLAKANRLDEAAVKCEQSLNYWSSDERQRAYTQLKSSLQKVNEEAQKKQIADRLWNECIELAKRKFYEQAWQKCDESLKYWHDDKRIEATAKLKEETRKVTNPSIPPTDSTDRDSTQPPDIFSRIDISGKWSTNWGEMNLIVSGDKVSGSYATSNGKIYGTLYNNVLEGYWTQSSSGRRCPTTMYDSYYWGKIKFNFEGNNFRGNWSYCNDDIPFNANHWTGQRISTGSSLSKPPLTTGESQVIFKNENIAGVYNNPTRPTIFTINQPHVITLIQNYHWNNGRGSNPGTIGLRDQSGRTYGPWQAKGSPGQGGVPNAYWIVYPNITIPAGTYTVIDSELSTWAQNSGSGGAGHTRIEGYPVSSNSGNQQAGNVNQQAGTINVEVTNASRENVHIFVEGQDTFGPHNRVVPNERKTLSIKAPVQAGFIKFVAGRNGQVLATCRWEHVPDYQNRVPVIKFSDPNILSCSTGIR